MKIGILTFHRAINYGAFLQAFALKRYLETLGHSVEIIDYWPKHHADRYSLFSCPPTTNPLGKVKHFVYAWIKLSRAYRRKRGMNRLFHVYLGLGKQVSYPTPGDLRTLNYDCVIYGSDQIWSNSVIGGYRQLDEVFWGAYVPKEIKKVAYAPSMGNIDIRDDEKDQIRDLLKKFSSLSVRETFLKNALNDLTDQEITVVLDPVFLVGKEEWRKFCQPVNGPPYVLFYNLTISKEADEFVEKIGRESGYRVIEITGRVDPFKVGKRYVQTASAFEFLSYIENAQFVVSTSFHGTAFSILFEKQFWSLGMGKNSGRVASLLGLLDIEERLIKDISFPLKGAVDYSLVTPKTAQLVSESRRYLQGAIS